MPDGIWAVVIEMRYSGCLCEQLWWQDDIVEVLTISANMSAGLYECWIQTLAKKGSLLVRQDGAVDFLNTARY